MEDSIQISQWFYIMLSARFALFIVDFNPLFSSFTKRRRRKIGSCFTPLTTLSDSSALVLRFRN
ncbi:hypothetical protein HanIR_Chr04g0188521 [Helianthus annuus]|nr:hypothetical protein HanIR_Chr04g0188521 [Helianthus annuus]